MDKLWAPWRKAYIWQKPEKGCFICKVKRSREDAKHFVLKRTAHSFALLNIFPYNNGHLLIVPNRHVKGLEYLNDNELLDLLRLTSRWVQRLQKVMKPHGMNLGINLGRAAGAGVPGHMHIHVVPRWNGDTNFMPITAGTKVISESLKSVYQELKKNLSVK